MAGKTAYRTPAYCRQRRPDGQVLAFVKLDGRRVYLGAWGSLESRERYGRRIAEWSATGRQGDGKAGLAGITISELCLAFWKHAETYYVGRDGLPSGEAEHYRAILRELRGLYGATAATAFGPRALRTVRDVWVKRGLARTNTNKLTNRLRKVFKWAVSQELVCSGVYEALRCVEPLKRGRTDARETEPVRPVADEHVNAVLQHVGRQVGALIRLQLLTGARPGEMLGLRALDIDMAGKVWAARLVEHKTAWHGHGRTLYFGPHAQGVLRGFMVGRAVNAPLFTPTEAEAERRAAQHAARVTPASCGNTPGSNRVDDPQRAPGGTYNVGSYRRAIHRACDKAGILRWSPHRLRHNAATRLRREFGIDLAQTILGHRMGSAITEIYAEANTAKAIEVMLRVG